MRNSEGLSTLKTLESAVGARIVIDGRSYINFGGSSYLGLAANPEILQAGVSALCAWGAGAPISRDHQIVTRAHLAVESEAATFFAAPAALYTASGYYFGLIGIAAMRAGFEPIFFDEMAHYSLREAIMASGLAHHAFRHLDAGDLSTKLRLHLSAKDRPLVATDGLFSTLGEISPLAEMAQAVAPYDGALLVDESHSFGVLGPLGRGAVEHHGIASSSVLVGGSLGKAFGVPGGIIPATQTQVAAFRETPAARGATVGMPAAAAMCAASLNYVRRHPELLQRLRANVTYLKNGLRKLGLTVTNNLAPIAAFVTPVDKPMQALKRELAAEGIFVYHSKYLGAGANGVIRCGIFADHTTEDLDHLLAALRRLL